MTLKLLDPRNFIDRGRVKVECGGKTYSRTVFWDYDAHDLYIWFKRKKYYYIEFSLEWTIEI